jgi:hypothetical protein
VTPKRHDEPDDDVHAGHVWLHHASLPAGLTLYWTVTNILSIIQQYFVTGWGSLADLIPRLKGKDTGADMKALPRTALPAEPVVSSELSTPEKPIKRRRRRK